MQMTTRKRSKRWSRMPVAIMVVLGLMLAFAAPVSADPELPLAAAGVVDGWAYEYSGSHCFDAPGSGWDIGVSTSAMPDDPRDPTNANFNMEWCIDIANNWLNDDNHCGVVLLTGSGGSGSLTTKDASFVLDSLSLTRTVTLMSVAGRYTNVDTGQQGDFLFDAYRDYCYSHGYTQYYVGTWRATPDPIPAAAGDGECGRSGTEVYRRNTSVGAVSSDIAVYDSLTSVETCLVVERNGERVVDESVSVSKEPSLPPPPAAVDVDPSAPDGEAPGSPCTTGFSDGDSFMSSYLLVSDTTSPAHVCVGVRAGGQQRHVRVTVD